MRNLLKTPCAMMKSVLIKSPGGVEKLYIGKVPIPSIQESQVLIKVMSSGINRMDLMQREGKYPVPDGTSEILGVECSGYIEDSMSSKFSKGEKVMTLVNGGTYSQYVSAPDAFCLKIPEPLTFPEAAGIPEVWLTAFQLIHFVAEFKKGESILIHAAASGVGCAAIQLAKMAGAKHIITTSRSHDKLSYCQSLGSTSSITIEDGTDFAKRVLEITGGKGVDVILDPIGATYFDSNQKSCALDARWVLYGLMGGVHVNWNIGKLLFKRISLRTSTLRSRSFEYKKFLIDNFRDSCLHKFEDGTLKTCHDIQFPFEQVKEAHNFMEENKNVGKITLDFSKAFDNE